ncbi:GNAT family N-acetyltransferase [Methanosarcina mazei]|uniref:N-acetyltransferase domain-containing protein n=1 Tax=Methanosarcina mazei TaxID=2209 RepID=A0A0F8JBA3_METMZ|nr:GNAT family N-acetyltransferase [Methanosarcina mazei]KKG72993.1 hypothetical protein DU63_16180 [Methanosarcina mazei]
MNVILPIKPKFVKEIIRGRKKYEFRKVTFKSKRKIDRVYIYSSSPEKKIVGSFKLGRIIEDTPEALWENLNEFAGIEKDEFFSYFGNRKNGFALEIKDLKIFDEPIDPYKELDSFVPPQNFSYINQDLQINTHEDPKELKICDFENKTIQEDNLISRILSESEISQLDTLLVPHLSKKYPNFEEWLEKVKGEIKQGTRIAFGEWTYGILISTIILKPTVSNTVELKSLFVDPELHGIGYGSKIYGVAEEQCVKMHFKKIIVDAFCEDDGVIHFLIKHGYTIYGKEDLYGVGKYSYLLSKDLKPHYFGDPFDWEEITRWLIENYFGFDIVETHPIVKRRALDFSIKRTINSKFEIKGLVEVKDTAVDQDPVSMLYQTTQDGGFHIPIFIGRLFTRRAVDFAKEKGVILISEKDISEITGWKPPEIKKQNIRGILLPIKPEFYQKILMKKLKNFVYFKGAPFGKSLNKNDKVVLYVESPRKEVSAYGIINSISIDSPEIQWETFKDKCVFDEQDFWRFANSKKEILAIELRDFQEIDPIRYEQLKNIIPPKMLSGSYIDNKIVEILIGKTT